MLGDNRGPTAEISDHAVVAGGDVVGRVVARFLPTFAWTEDSSANPGEDSSPAHSDPDPVRPPARGSVLSHIAPDCPSNVINLLSVHVASIRAVLPR